MAIQPIKFLVSPSATATNGSKTITVTGSVDCSHVYSGTAISLGTRQVVEAISGTKPDPSGNSTITLRENWSDPSTTAKLIAYNTIEGLAEAIRRAREVVQASEAALSGNISYMGDYDASTGTLPPQTGDGLGSQIYRIAAAGTVGPIDYKVGDLVIYDQFNDGWLLVRNSPANDGTGATGTWSINVTGNAASVTNGFYTVGNQTAGGNKTFSGEVKFSRTSKVAGTFDVGTTAPSNTTRLNYDGHFYATSFFGVGTNLTALNASNLGSGTVPAARMPAFTGDATAAAGTTALTLSNSGVTAGTYPKVTVDAKGRVTVGANLIEADIPALSIAKTTGLQTALSGKAPLTGAGVSGTWPISVTGNAATATTLATARNINGKPFNGSENITTAHWGTPRNLTLGNTAKSVNGSANVSWTIDEIGAYHPSNIVGTVSQSAGIPTGAVIQRGSNSNGKYVRFADGSQIAEHKATYTTGTGGSLWTYPLSFSEPPVVTSGQVGAIGNAALVSMNPPTNAAVAFGVISSPTGAFWSADSRVDLIAKGYWFN